MAKDIPVEVFSGQDFYVPAFRILVESQEIRVPMNDILSVTYSDSLAAIDSFNLTVNNWDAERLTFKYSDTNTFNPWKSIEVWMGYIHNGQDERQRMLTGDITTLAPNFPSAGGPTLSVGGVNLLQRFRIKQLSRQFFQKKDTEVAQNLVEQIAQDVKKQIPKLELLLDPDDVERNLKREQPIPYLVLNNQYPILFLMERARRIGYELTMEEAAQPDKRVVRFHFRPTSYVSRPTYVLEWGKSLINFQPTLQTANQVAEVTVRGWDVGMKKEFKETATRADLRDEKVINPSQDLAVTEPSLAQKQEIVVDRPIQTQPEAKELARKTLRQIAQDLVIAKGKTIGLPALRAGAKVQIRGLGERFSGKKGQPPLSYLVTETTHSIAESGYTTDFSARMEKS